MSCILKAEERTSSTKSEVKTLRKKGFIPAVLYSVDSAENKSIYVSLDEFVKFVSKIEKDSLSVTPITLELSGKEVKVIVKGIEYSITGYPLVVDHIDFMPVSDESIVTVKVPVRLKNHSSSECAGVKVGGIARKNRKYVKIKGVWSSIPKSIIVDMAKCDMGQSIKLGECIEDSSLQVVGLTVKDALGSVGKKH